MLNFKKIDWNRWNAVGYEGTHYDIYEDEGLFYPECDGTEYKTFEEAVAHCVLRDDCEAMLDELERMGVVGFDHMGQAVESLRIDCEDALFIWCPDTQTTAKFCEWTGKMADCYRLDRATTCGYSKYGANLFKYESYGYETVDDTFAKMIWNYHWNQSRK